MPTSIHRYILATAGHVDHGKSAIVCALTGIDPDRLPEEKSRGITIDLGFAHVDLKTPEVTFRLGVIDVPGHEDFVHNMVAGVGSVDVALLVVAADDGWMPQTEEHLQILEYQGVARGVVVVNKIDLAEDRAGVIAAVRDKLQGSALADAPVIAVSALTGEGIDDLKTSLVDVLRRTPEPLDIRKPRLHVDRTFTVAGAGTIVTGTLSGGAITRGQNVIVQPGEKPAKVRAVQSHNRDVPTAVPGSRVALNLPDLRLGARATVRRGDTLTVAGLGSAATSIDVELRRSSRYPNAKPLRSGLRVFVHVGTAAVAGRVLLLGRKVLEAGQQAIAQLRFDTPVYAFIGDRLILRDAAQRATIAGGIVLDADASPRRWTAAPRAELLAARAAAPNDVEVFVNTEVRYRRAVRSIDLLAQSNFSLAAIALASAATPGAQGQGNRNGALECRDLFDVRIHPHPNPLPDDRERGPDILHRAGWLIDAAVWQRCLGHAADMIDAHLRQHPAKLGVTTLELRAGLGNTLPADELFEALLTDLAHRGFVRRGASIAPKAHHPSLPENLRVAGERIQAALAERPLEPPNRNELAPTPADAAALRFLIDTGQAIAVGDELVLSCGAIETATEIVRRHVAAHGPSSASELKTSLGTTRRIIIPLLEYFDRHGITRRAGDKRILK